MLADQLGRMATYDEVDLWDTIGSLAYQFQCFFCACVFLRIGDKM